MANAAGGTFCGPAAVRVLIAFGVLARLVRYLHGLSLWGDEAALALAIQRSSWSGLLAPMDYHQSAPAGFLFLEKAAASLFGIGEYSWRLLPLAAGIASIFLFHRIARRVLGPKELPWAMLLFCLSEPLVFYSAQVKHYSTEVLAALLVLDACFSAAREGVTASRVAALGILGLAGIWFSHTLVFVLAGTSLVLLAAEWHHRRLGNAAALGFIVFLWTVDFTFLYQKSLRQLKADDYIEGFWEKFYFRFPKSPAALGVYLKAFLQYFNDPLHLQAAELAALVFLLGAISLARRDRTVLAICLAPFAMLAVAAHLQLYPMPTNRVVGLAVIDYPLTGRLILFTLPLAFIVMAFGLRRVSEVSGKRYHYMGLIVLVLLLALPLFQTVVGLFKPRQIQDARPVMEAIDRELQPQDTVFIQSYGLPVAKYYALLLGWKVEPEKITLQVPADRQDLVRRVNAISRGGRFWIVSLHFKTWRTEEEQERIETLLENMAVRLREFKAYQASAALYRMER